MEYSKIIAITGLPGLFELISSKSDGGIVRSLDDKSTKFVSSRVHQFSHLESIEVYTTRHNVNLVDVLKAMAAPDFPGRPLPCLPEFHGRLHKLARRLKSIPAWNPTRSYSCSRHFPAHRSTRFSQHFGRLPCQSAPHRAIRRKKQTPSRRSRCPGRSCC